MTCLLFICWHLTLTNWICTIYMPLNKLGKLSRTFQTIFRFCYFIMMTEILKSTKKKELKLWPHSGMHFCRLYVTEHYPKRKEMAREKECFKFSQFIHLDTHEMWVEWYLEVLVPNGAILLWDRVRRYEMFSKLFSLVKQIIQKATLLVNLIHPVRWQWKKTTPKNTFNVYVLIKHWLLCTS